MPARKRPSSLSARSSWCRSCSLCSSVIRSRSTVAFRKRRFARRMMAATISRSRMTSGIESSPGSGPALGQAFKNNCGCWRMRCRMFAGAPRHASYNCLACRLVNRYRAKTAAICSHCSTLERATGTRYFIATCAAISPQRTCCCTVAGSSSTSAKRRETQLTLRSNRRANSSSP